MLEHWRAIGGARKAGGGSEEDRRRIGGGSEEGWRKIGEGLEEDGPPKYGLGTPQSEDCVPTSGKNYIFCLNDVF